MRSDMRRVRSPTGRGAAVKPYYEDDLVTLYHGDALEILPQLPKGAAKAVITDPPYVLGQASSQGKAGAWSDLMNGAFWFTTWYRHIPRLLAHGGSFWTFANWRTLPTVARAASDAAMHISGVVVWDKQIIGTGGNRGLRSTYELIALMPAPGFVMEDRALGDVWRYPVNIPQGVRAPGREAAGNRVPDLLRLSTAAAVAGR